MDITVNRLLNKLKENYIDNIDLIALLSEENIEIVYFKDDDIILKYEDMGFIKSNNKKLIVDAINMFKFSYVSISTNLDVKFIEEKYRLTIIVNNWVYLKEERVPVAGNDIRKLDESHIEYLDKNYSSNRDYLLYVLEKGMYGYFIDNNLVAFIGMHDELSMGLLYVDKKYRNLKIGYCLEGYLINRLLDEKKIIYCQVATDNTASQKLQEKLGLIKSDQINYWFNRLEIL